MPPSRAQSFHSDRPRSSSTAAAEVEPKRTLLQTLLCPFAAVFHFIFTDSFVPADTFVPKMRKVIAGGFLLVILSLITNVVDFITTLINPAATQDQLMYAYLEFVFYDLLPIIAALVAFIYCRLTHSAPDWVVGLPALILILSELFYSLATATVDLVPALLLLYGCFACSILNRIWMCIGFFACILTIVLNGLIITRTLDWTIPGARNPHAPETMFMFVSTQLFCFLLFVLFMYIVIRQFDRMINKAQAAATVSKDLARKLRRYDTDGAREVLKRCVTSSHLAQDSDALVIDAELLEAFSGIIENLEQYRPHLPNYLMNQSVTRESDTGEDGEASGEVDTSPSTPGRPAASQWQPMVVNTAAHRGSKNVTPVPAAANRSFRLVDIVPSDEPVDSLLTRGGGGPRTPMGDGNGLMIDALLMTSVTAGDVSMLRREPTGVLTTMVTTTLIDFTRLRPSSLDKSVLDAIVGLANDIAGQTQASLHSIFGDRLVATWNATKRISKPETRGCIFAIRFRDQLAKSQSIPKGSISMASMTATGPGESCFAGDHRLRLFACTSSAWHAARAGLDRTRHLHIAATDGASREHAAVDISLRGLTLIKSVPGAADVGLRVYELISERQVHEKDEEWMYTLQHQATDLDSKLTEAFEVYAEGRLSEALTMLRDTLRTTAPSYAASPTVAELLKEMEQAAR